MIDAEWTDVERETGERWPTMAKWTPRQRQDWKRALGGFRMDVVSEALYRHRVTSEYPTPALSEILNHAKSIDAERKDRQALERQESWRRHDEQIESDNRAILDELRTMPAGRRARALKEVLDNRWSCGLSGVQDEAFDEADPGTWRRMLRGLVWARARGGLQLTTERQGCQAPTESSTS